MAKMAFYVKNPTLKFAYFSKFAPELFIESKTSQSGIEKRCRGNRENTILDKKSGFIKN